MPEDLFAGGIAFIDEDVFLYVEADDFFAPDVLVNFQGTHQGSSSAPSTVAFSEKLTAQQSTLRDPKKAKGQKATRIPWKVNINKNPNFKDTTVILTFTVTGKSIAGPTMVAGTQDKIVIGALRVTQDPKLTRIMVHEFAKPSGSSFVFDPAPLEAYLGSLTGEQKRTLFKHAIAKPQGRLIVFITIYPKKDLRMNADYCEQTKDGTRLPRHCVRPNATFSVFHCFDPIKGGVTLVCHTEHFLLNLKNWLGTTKSDGTPRVDPRDTWIEIHKKQNGKQPNDWLKKSNSNPIQYKIASEFPQEAKGGRTNDGVIWNRLFTPKGRDIMTGNTLHGMINTVGCWMLFRNYNWPRSISDRLDLILRRDLRGRMSASSSPAARCKVGARIASNLAAVGYDALSPLPIAASPAGASESHLLVTITTLVPHGFGLGDCIVISGVGVSGYNGTFPVAAVLSPTQFTFKIAPPSLPPSGGGTCASLKSRSTSINKFLNFDVNFAYVWFFHEIVGIKYFSDRHSFGDPSFGSRSINEKTAIDCHKDPFEKTFPPDQVDQHPAFNLPEEGTFAFHDSGQRKFVDHSFQVNDSLWRDNALGFRTASGFIPHGKEFADLPGQIDSLAWADVYLYREDDVDVNKLTTKNYSEDDPDI